ncbi:hypothetical protein [Carboxylicivirga sp. M1479]|uniref:hypothetical protein n=1 Tax=Carboxylicivirga sp. M1479 TaxID=2594476 RepID=UPI001177CA47|nr:hypothetical protein [Carboxylicivirga sp. M1479]TRX70213.1 hypothetical protein FNN09_12055 [Carboxylicivirga sp. M1479]
MFDWQKNGWNTFTYKNPYNLKSDIKALTEEEITWAVDYHVDFHQQRTLFKNVAHWPVHVCDNKNWPYHVAKHMLESIIRNFNATNINYTATLQCLKAIDNKKRDNDSLTVYDDDTNHSLAERILPVLSCAAFKQETINFKQLNQESDLELGTNIAYPLKYIRDFLLRKNLPDLVSLVITKSGEPTKYYKQYSKEQLQRIRYRAFNHDWINHPIRID